jgi:hypothetical protein
LDSRHPGIRELKEKYGDDLAKSLEFSIEQTEGVSTFLLFDDFAAYVVHLTSKSDVLLVFGGIKSDRVYLAYAEEYGMIKEVSFVDFIFGNVTLKIVEGNSTMNNTLEHLSLLVAYSNGVTFHKVFNYNILRNTSEQLDGSIGSTVATYHLLSGHLTASGKDEIVINENTYHNGEHLQSENKVFTWDNGRFIESTR